MGMSQHVNLLQLNAFTGVQVFLICALVIGSGRYVKYFV